jgi:hypothetical protein
MSAVNDWIVREYFEMLGYLVTQPRKYTVPRHKTAGEEVDLVVINPSIKEHKLPESFVWYTDELKTVARAIVAVRGWHTERFYVSTFEQAPHILRFAAPESMRCATKLIGTDSIAKILCLPNLPATGELKQKTIQTLRDKGVDGIISFETILSEIVERVDVNRNYDKSDLLQVIRLLKNYGQIRDRQLDMFAKRSRRAGSAEARVRHAAAKPAAPPSSAADQPEPAKRAE